MGNFIFCAVKALHMIDKKVILETIDLNFNQNSDEIELSEISPTLNDYKAISANVNIYFVDIDLDTVAL